MFIFLKGYFDKNGKDNRIIATDKIVKRQHLRSIFDNYHFLSHYRIKDLKITSIRLTENYQEFSMCFGGVNNFPTILYLHIIYSVLASRFIQILVSGLSRDVKNFWTKTLQNRSRLKL